MQPSNPSSPFALRNVRLFIAFRVFFNARFYYPIFTILFLDFGLSLEQFAILNAVWAASIVILEVPSGALADTIGRRNLLVFSGALMVVEMALLCFAPRSNPDLLFIFFLINRVLSGAAEASASGADEALAYDTLKTHGDPNDWPRVLERQMRLQSVAFMVAMSVGAAVYDPALMQAFADLLGFDAVLTQQVTLRFPLVLTFMMAILTLLTTWRMREEGTLSKNGRSTAGPKTRPLMPAFKKTLSAGRWILQTPYALVIILAGLFFDSCIRMIITLNSQYYRLIDLPEASFGLISSAMALLGLIIPHLAFKLVRRHSPLTNWLLMLILTLLGLSGMTFFWPLIGLLPVVLLRIVMYLLNFFQSHYLNRITESEQRATVLSFKGLSFNLAYGLIGVFYSILLALLRSRIHASRPGLPDPQLDNLVFIESISWFPPFFLLTMAFFFFFARRKLRDTLDHKK